MKILTRTAGTEMAHSTAQNATAMTEDYMVSYREVDGRQSSGGDCFGTQTRAQTEEAAAAAVRV